MRTPRSRLSPWMTVAVALATVALALAAKLLIRMLLSVDVGYAPFVVAVAVSAYLGGWRSGTLALLLTVGIDAVYQVQVGPFDVADPDLQRRFTSFLVVSVVIVWAISAVQRSRDELAEVADRYLRALDAAPDLVLIVRPSDRVVEYANAAAKTMGWRAAALVGRNVDEVMPGFSELDHDESIRQASTRFLGEDGAEVPVEISVHQSDMPRWGPRLMVTVRDARERVEARARLLRLASDERVRGAQLRAMVEAFSDPVCVLDSSGEAILSNEAMTSLIGGRLTGEVALRQALGVDAPALAAWSRESTQEVQVGEKWYEVRVFPVSHEVAATSERLIVVRDVTETRRQLAAREAFIGVLSHELRTPVTTILGLSKILSRPGARIAPEQRTELLQDIAIEAERMHRLVEDLLILSRSDGARLEIEPEPVLIQRATPTIVAAEADRYPNLRFVADVDADLPPVAGDQTFVEQILRNVIGNAAKYSPETAGEVRITSTVRDSEVWISVQDAGPGIVADDADRIFELFYRGPDTATRPGAGIGLYVTRQLVLAMGGRVWAESRPEGGAEFFVVLPVMAPDSSGDQMDSLVTSAEQAV